MTPVWAPPPAALVVGYRVTGQAVADLLTGLGCEVTVIEDRPDEANRRRAAERGHLLLEQPERSEVERLAALSELVVVSPGIPPAHPAIVFSRPEALISEIELAFRLGDTPVVAITGTNGKTTVTSLVALMLQASGVGAIEAGNIGTPLVEVPTRAAGGPELVVAEVSSFQLALTRQFRPIVGTWLNLAEDHLDWHGDLAAYAAAKARIWANQTEDDVAVANAAEPTVLTEARRHRGRLVTFAAGEPEIAHYHLHSGRLVGPNGEVFCQLSELPRAMPHDVANTLAAIATAMSAGGTVEGCREAALAFEVAGHRIERVGTVDGVGYYDDSKATTPSAVSAALAGFTSVVLIAGGRNKGLDLGAIAREAAARPQLTLRAVVAIGEAADEIAGAFEGSTTVLRAASMREAVAEAAAQATAGDSVLLSPGCASFDSYGSYAERGDDFARSVRALAASAAVGA